MSTHIRSPKGNGTETLPGGVGRADWRSAARLAEGDPDEQRNTAPEQLPLRGLRTRWIGAGLVATRRGLDFGALMLAGAALLLALPAPLLVAGLAAWNGHG